jgi:Cys-tRNA(Pro) deacylase
MPETQTQLPPDTKVIKLLQERAIPFKLLPHDEPVFTVDAAAAQRGVVKEEMVKSILLRDRKRHYVMACVTGDARLDPKAVSAVMPEDWKRLSFATADEIRRVTGYTMGAVAPVALPAEVPVVFDRSITTLEKVNISSGDPLAGLELAARDLIRLAGASVADISKS